MAAVRTVLVAHPGSELFGSDRMALESVRAFREAGDRVVVALPESGPLVDELVASGAQVVILPQLVLRKALMKPSGWLRLFRDTFRGLGSGWRLISRVRPDAIYVSTITIPEWPALARMRGIPSVTHVHEAEASGSRAINTALYVPHLLSNSVVVNSQFSLNTIRASLPSLARRAEVVYNGVLGPENPSEPRAAIEGPLRILYMGRLSPRKGPDLILSAAAMLRAEGISAEVINIHTIKPLDEEAILESVKKTGCAVSAEEHQINGGLGDSIAQVLSRHNPAPLEYVGVNDSFGESGTPTQLLEKYGLNAENIVKAAKAALARK